MPMTWSYLGKLGPEGKLDWGGSSTGNIPATGWILPDLDDLKIYLKIREHARNGNYEGKQIDWGAFAIKVNGPELLTVLSECHDNIESVNLESLLGRYVSYAKSLGSKNYVAFVSVEL